jgi:hypothetical protein
VDEVGDEWEGVLVGDHPLVEVPVVLDWPVLAILFLDQEEPSSIRGFGFPDALQLPVLHNELVLFLFLSGGERIDATIDG